MVQDENGSVLGFEMGEPALDPVPVFDREVGRNGVRRPRGREAQLDDLAPALALGLAITGTNDETPEPGVDAIGIPQAADVAPGGDERLLNRIVGAVGITEDELGNGVQSADRPVDQHGEGVMIALPRSFGQVLLHVPTLEHHDATRRVTA